MQSTLPTLRLGSHEVSRLIVGANTINGGSHLSRFTNEQMREYFSTDKVLEHLEDCARIGINAWQSGLGNLSWYEALRARGVEMDFLSLAGEPKEAEDTLERLAAAGTIAVFHHGEFTDSYFKEGRLQQVREYCRRIRDAGMLVGVSTHMPAAMETILEEDWDVDAFMCCVYERHRTRDELQQLLGHVPLPVAEVYLESDPPRMYEVMQKTEKPCLAFKILAAGRLCDRQESVEAAFRDTLANIKPNDGIIVGMYPKYEDQPALNREYVVRYSALSQANATERGTL